MNVDKYREQVKFDAPDTPPSQRAKLLLFYVTKLAELRNDMTPEIIKNRLHDWGYDDITVPEIQKAFDKDPDVRQSWTRKDAYEITKVAEKKFKKKFNLLDMQLQRHVLIDLSFASGLISIVVLLALISYNLATSNLGIRDLSFPEFRRRIEFDEKTTKPSERSKYFLYFITQIVQLRTDMTPDIIEARLRDIGYNDFTTQEIEKAFLVDPDVRHSTQRPDAYQINPLAYEKFETMLDLKIPPNEPLTLKWLWRHIPLQGWISLAGALGGIFSASFALGYKLALRAQRDNL